MKVHLNVTAMDITKGKRESICECPIARALERALKNIRGYHSVAVHGSIRAMKAVVKRHVFKADHTPVTQAFVERFDAGEPVEPFEMDLEFRKLY